MTEEKVENKILSKWKRAKRISERTKKTTDTSNSLNKFIGAKETEEKLGVLDKAIESLENISDPNKERKIIPATKEELDKFREGPPENVQNFKIGDKEYRFNITDNVMMDILREVIKEKGKENFDPKDAVARLDEYLGDKASESVHFKFYKIPENDRLKYYQLFVKYSHFLIYEQQKILGGKDFSDVWEAVIQPIIDHGRIFELEDELIPILNNTDSTKTEIPFNQLILDCRIPIDDRIYYGLAVGKYFWDDTKPYGIVPESEVDGRYVLTGILSCFSMIDQKDGERKMYYEFFEIESTRFIKDKKLNNYQKRLISFFYSFCNFINEPEVEVIDTPFNPKNNQRRAERGSMPLPSNNRIRISGKLKEYVSKYNSGLFQGFSHRFAVRGHFRHFRSEKRYAGLYKLPEEELTKKGYQKVNGMIKKWIKPFIKGQGIMVDKTYKVVKGGQKEDE